MYLTEEKREDTLETHEIREYEKSEKKIILHDYKSERRNDAITPEKYEIYVTSMKQ